MILLSPKAKQNITDEDISIFKANALEGLPRNRRRELQREMDSMEKALKTMTPNQLKLLDIISEQKASQKLDRVVEIIDRCISAQYIIKNPKANLDELNEYQDDIAKLIQEDNEKDYEFKYGGNEKMSNEKIKSLENKMKERIVELLEEGKNQKQSLEILAIEFPTLSKASITNTFKKTKETWKANTEKTDVDKAVEYIFSEDKRKEDVAVKEENTECSEMKEVQASNNKELDKLEVEKDSKEEKSKMSLKIKKMVVEGEFGLYEVEGNVITSEKQDLSFGKLEELEEYRVDEVAKIDARVNEFKEVFAMLK